MTKQIFPFFFCFIRELNPHVTKSRTPPLTLSLCPPIHERARPACAPALQPFRCVGAWVCAHTPGKRAILVRTAAARAGFRPALSSPIHPYVHRWF